MSLFAPLLLLAVLVLGVFTASNWGLLITPGTLSFVVFSVEAPLGIVMLGILLAFMALFGLYVLSLRTAMLLEARRHAQEFKAQRDLAERAEASRLTALRAQLDQEFAHLRDTIQDSAAQAVQRDAALEQTLTQSLAEASNGLSAYVGMVDDKLNRLLPNPDAPSR